MTLGIKSMEILSVLDMLPFIDVNKVATIYPKSNFGPKSVILWRAPYQFWPSSCNICIRLQCGRPYLLHIISHLPTLS